MANRKRSKKRRVIHPLRRYLMDSDLNQTALAASIGKSPQLICDIIAGRVEPSSPVMRDIYAATNGFVTPDDLVFWHVS